MSPRKEHNGTCIDCKRKFRPLHSEAALYPDQPAHHGRGRCGNCWHINKRATVKSDGEESAKFVAPRQNVDALLRDPQHVGRLIVERARFEEDRTRRGIPTAGIPRVRLAITRCFIALPYSEVAA